MASSTANYDTVWNSQTAVWSSQTSEVEVRYPLLEKLRNIGFTAQSFREKYCIRKPDFSNYLRGRRYYVGKKAWRNINEAFIAEGLMKPRKVYPRLPCPTCGRWMREDAPSRLAARLNTWLAQPEKKQEHDSGIHKKNRARHDQRLNTIPLLRRIPQNLERMRTREAGERRFV